MDETNNVILNEVKDLKNQQREILRLLLRMTTGIMAKSRTGSTQKFTGIKDIVDDIVILDNGNACLVIELKASNFALLSKQEQDTKIYSYAALLNSLSFAVQIVTRNKKIDISNYLNFLEQEAKKLSSMEATKSTTDLATQQLRQEAINGYMNLYKDFIEELVTVNSVLDKKFYMVLSYSSLEKGIGTAASTKKGSGNSFVDGALESLHTKAETLHSQIARLGLHAKTLQGDELIKLYYDIYNPEQTSPNEVANSIKAPIIKGQEAQ